MAALFQDERCLVLIDKTYFELWKTQQAISNWLSPIALDVLYHLFDSWFSFVTLFTYLALVLVVRLAFMLSATTLFDWRMPDRPRRYLALNWCQHRLKWALQIQRKFFTFCFRSRFIPRWSTIVHLLTARSASSGSSPIRFETCHCLNVNFLSWLH